MSSVKTMKDEMNEEWTELAIENIHRLIPEEWMPRINEILPKILNIVKIGVKKNIRDVAQSLGDSKLHIMMNYPYQLKDGSTMMVPAFIRIDKKQLGPSVYNEKTGEYELQLRSGEQPEAMFSMLTLIEKLDKYNDIKDLVLDIKEGRFFTKEDISAGTNQQKQIEA